MTPGEMPETGGQEPVRCDRCGGASPLRELFASVRRSFRRSRRTLCPRCREEAPRRAVARFAIVGGALFLLILFPAWLNQGDASLPNLVLFLAFLPVAEVGHEVGHALGARLVGSGPVTVELGRGRVLATFRCCSVLFIVRGFRAGGHTLAAPAGTSFQRLRRAFRSLAGPLANLGLAAAALPLVEPGRVLGPGLSAQVEPARMWLLTNLLIAASTLLPYRWGRSESDGRRLLRTLRGPPVSAEQIRLALAVTAAVHYRYAQAWEKLEKVSGAYLDDPAAPSRELFLLLRAGARLRRHRLDEARADVEAALAVESTSLELRLSGQDTLATLDVLQARLDAADRRTEELIRLAPWSASLQGTRGLVLALTGRADEAMPLLEDAWSGLDDPQARSWAAASLSIAERARGNREAAERHRRKAVRLDPGCPLLPLLPGPGVS